MCAPADPFNHSADPDPRRLLCSCLPCGAGTGKTLLARAVAGEAGVPFYSVSGTGAPPCCAFLRCAVLRCAALLLRSLDLPVARVCGPACSSVDLSRPRLLATRPTAVYCRLRSIYLWAERQPPHRPFILPFLFPPALCFAEFMEMFVGVGASRVRDMFTKARENVRERGKGRSPI
jgi:hypothetical protein